MAKGKTTGHTFLLTAWAEVPASGQAATASQALMAAEDVRPNSMHKASPGSALPAHTRATTEIPITAASSWSCLPGEAPCTHSSVLVICSNSPRFSCTEALHHATPCLYFNQTCKHQPCQTSWAAGPGVTLFQCPCSSQPSPAGSRHSRTASIIQPPRIACQEEEMPRIFQLFVRVPSLSATPKNTHGKERCHRPLTHCSHTVILK